jgi:hypothetical protein
MSKVGGLGVLVALLGVVGPLAADEPLAPREWADRYAKSGGKASLGKADEPDLQIQKRAGQLPLIGLKRVPPAAGVRWVCLQGFEVADDDLAALAEWPDLERVAVIDGKKVTDRGVKALAARPGLRKLVLADTAVTGAGLAALSGHRSLVHLTVTNANLPNRVAELDLRDLPRLETLSLVCEGMEEIRLRGLTSLRWVGDFPRSLERAELSSLPALTDLDFRGTRLRSLAVSGVPKLEGLDLRDTLLGPGTASVIEKQLPGVAVRK